MAFLTPLFWLGAAALSVPILLHLSRRQVRNPIPFPSLMFLRRIPFQETRRRKLKHLLLLALRCLALLLIVAAFAQPVVDGSWLGTLDPTAARSVVLLVDRSMSVSQTAAWQEVLRVGRQQLSSLAEDDEAMIIQFGAMAQAVTSWEADPPRLAPQLESLVSPSFETTSYSAALELAVEQLEEASHQKHEIVLISDLQASGLDLTADIEIPATVQLRVESVRAAGSNIFIDEVRLERDVFQSTYPHALLARLASSPPEASEGEALLYLGGELIDRQSYSMGDSGAATVSLRPFEVPDGTSRGRLVLDSSDSLAADDVYYFVLQKSTPFEITLVSAAGRNSALYLEDALSAGENLPFTTTTSSGLVAATSPVVVLNDLSRPPSRERLTAQLGNGGGVIISLGNSVRSDLYNQQLSELLPATIKQRRFTRTSRSPFTAITEASWEHPIFSVFQDNLRSSLSDVQFYGYWEVDPVEGAEVLARFATGDPALVERKAGKGTVLLLTSSLDRVWTDFPLRSAYVPFCQQMIEYASGWQTRPAALAVSHVLSLAEWDRRARQGQSRKWDVIDPSGGRVLSLGEESPEFVPLVEPGYYEIRSNKATDWVAVNTISAESDLMALSEEEFSAALRQAQPDDEELRMAGQEADPTQQPLWWLFLLVAGVVLVTESAVANRLVGKQRVGS